MQNRLSLLPALALMIFSAGSGKTAESFRGPVEATVVRIQDGDTFLADAHVWPGHTVRVNIRIRGIDAPEKRARCAWERERAAAAREALAALIPPASTVIVSSIGGAKYYGRVLADVSTAEGEPIAETLLKTGLVVSYSGGRRISRCG